jgi:TetR/AcrR family transcriptional regulator, mexJK operon transcriptional repressor
MSAAPGTERRDRGGKGDGVEEDGRSARKRRAIMEAATAVFLGSGYLGTSMDEIAARAAVSKQTVYKHFADKERLFTEIILATIDRVGEPFHAEVITLGDTDDLEDELGTVARRLIAAVMAPDVLKLRRLVIAEADRFPELGRTYYERGPGRTAAALAPHLRRLAERELLRLDDPLAAAHQFNWLITSVPLNQVMLCGSAVRFTGTDLEGFADAGVRLFLDAYGRT